MGNFVNECPFTTIKLWEFHISIRKRIGTIYDSFISFSIALLFLRHLSGIKISLLLWFVLLVCSFISLVYVIDDWTEIGSVNSWHAHESILIIIWTAIDSMR